MELHNQIAKSGVRVDVDARKGQDLVQLMAEIRSKYENIAQKNQEELKSWHESQVRLNCILFSSIQKKIYENSIIFTTILSFSQIIEVRSEVAQKTEALKCAQTEVNDLHRQIQTLEIDLESQRSLVRSNKSAYTLFSFFSTQAYLNVSIYYCDNGLHIGYHLQWKLSAYYSVKNVPILVHRGSL